MKLIIRLTVITLLFASLSPLCALAQVGTPFNERDDQYRLLGLKRAKESFETARSEYERKQELFKTKLISEQDLDQARNRFADAEVNYQQSLLAVLFEKQFVSVLKAVKRQTDDGQKRVTLTVANVSGGGAEFRKLLNIDEELFNALQPDVINDIYISLLDNDNVIISQPYEAKIERLKFGKPVEVEFVLLQDLDVVTVDMIYGSGSQRSPKIYLQKDATVNKVVVQSEQFSQEVELGGEATFDLTLELFSLTANTFKLEIVNLPRQINRRFVDPASKARLSQFKFTERANTRRAELQVFLPDRPAEDVVIDGAIPFYVLVVPRDEMERLKGASSRLWTREEIDALDVGSVRLEIVPRGVGKLLVRAPQLYHTIKPDESVSVRIDVVNEGSRRLDNVEIDVDTPLNWEKTVTPKLIPALEISEDKAVTLAFSPPKDVSVGRYEFRVRTTSLADDRPVNAEDKNMTIEVKPTAKILETTIIITLIIGVILGIVIFGIRLSRR
ncbi:NEW3 domain-containing protein [Acidobacteriota bacterium]